jgi:L-alanine-DL-glutamate epimerase-like enolase superfamily enzyme
MKNKIIYADIFEVKVTEKTTWLFIKLINYQNIVGWGEATLQGKSKEIFLIKDQIF